MILIKEGKNQAMIANCSPTQSPEQKSIFALLGLRFWDAVNDRQVSDGLVVTVWPETGSSHLTKAFRTSSGNYAFQGLPGLRDFEYPDIQQIGLGSPPKTKRFVVKVRDDQRRFLPFVFCVDLPLPRPGLFRIPIFNDLYPSSPPSSPPETDSRFYLFSSPTRSLSPGIAVVRAQLKIRDKDSTDKFVDAANAVVEVLVKGKKWFGISDDNGSVGVFLPYLTPDHASPPYSTKPLHGQKWSISVRVRYSETQKMIEDKETPGRALPDLNEILKQPEVNVLLAQNTTAPELAEELQYGRELVLKTKITGSPPVDCLSFDCSSLYIETITSP